MTTLTALVAAAGAFVVALIAAYFKGRGSVAADRSKKDAQLRAEYDRIDRRAPDLDAAIDGLRKRSDDQPSSK